MADKPFGPLSAKRRLLQESVTDSDAPDRERLSELMDAILTASNFQGLGLGSLAKGAAAKLGPLAMAGVIKNKGGNWLTGSVEDALKGLKRPLGEAHNPAMFTDEMLADPRIAAEFGRRQKESSLNNWIDKQLSRYVKNEMATPEDPIRALAEKGVLHMPPQEGAGWIPDEVARRRKWGGFPEEGMAKSDLAQQWENASDYMVEPYSAGHVANSSWLVDNPWAAKLDPKTPIFKGEKDLGRYGELGFPHLIDELSNAINPASGLPAHLQFPADRLGKVSVPQAVERVAQINAWRAAQKAEADAAKANNAATVLHKEYEGKPYRWVELKGREIAPEGDPSYGNKAFAWQKASDDSRKELQDALKYEGDTMGHCVGGYCDDVINGRSRIFSLRDAKGQPHVTIETQSGGKRNDPRFEAGLNFDDEAYRQIRREQPRLDDESDDFMEAVQGRANELADAWNAKQPVTGPERIVQIKGKANRAPNEEYLPFVQDFVKSGKWSDVGDLENTGLRRSRDVWNDLEQQKIRDAGHEFGDFVSPEEKETIGKAVWGDLWGKYAQGGKVYPRPGQESPTTGTRGLTVDDLRAIIAALEAPNATQAG